MCGANSSAKVLSQSAFMCVHWAVSATAARRNASISPSLAAERQKTKGTETTHGKGRKGRRRSFPAPHLSDTDGALHSSCELHRSHSLSPDQNGLLHQSGAERPYSGRAHSRRSLCAAAGHLARTGSALGQ